MGLVQVAAADGTSGHKADAPPEANRQRTSPADIRRWITELNSDQYLSREKATLELRDAGLPALDPLLQAANGQKLEAADRAIWVLQQLADVEDQDRRYAALLRLVQVEGHPEVVQPAVEELALIEHNRALAALARLGGVYERDVVDERFGQRIPSRVLLDQRWKGGDEGMKHVAAIIDTPVVEINGAAVSVDGILELRDMPLLQSLYLCNMDLDIDQLTRLQAELTNVRIDFRRGALLGVTAGRQLAGPALVGEVRSGTAAEAAGIQPGDVIHKLNGQNVRSFEHLTDLIRILDAGDEATLEIHRGEQTLTKKVRFGSW